MTTPEEIQSEIDRTRQNLSTDVDRLTEKVSPGQVVSRRVENVKGAASSLRDRVMGSADGGGLRGAGDTLSSKASQLGDAAGSAPQAVRNQTQGNPLAAGLIAFGVGWLLSSTAPASAPEQRLAAKAESSAKELAEPVKQAGQDMAQQLKEPVQQSVEQVKATATDAAQQTTDQAKHAAGDVKQAVQQ
jgi:gas vesicle protein